MKVFNFSKSTAAACLFTLILAAWQTPAQESKKPALLVMEPVNLNTRKVSPELGQEFRKIFSTRDHWEVIDYAKMSGKFTEYDIDINKPCKEMDCAFDGAQILQARYSLFSTVTHYDKYFIFSFNLIDVSITQVIWAEVGEILIKKDGNASEALLHRLAQLVAKMDPEKFATTKIKSKGTLGIINVSKPSEHSKVLFERLSAQTYSSGQYELVGQTELEFMLENLEIDLSSLKASEEVLVPLGDNLGIDHMIYFDLKTQKDEFNLQLSLFDIKAKKMVRQWPYKSKDFRKLLKFEDKFYSNLNTVQESPASGAVVKSGGGKWKWISGTALFIAGGVFGALAVNEHRIGDEKYQEWESANTLEEVQNRRTLQDQTNEARLKRNIYGVLAGGLVIGAVYQVAF